MVDAGLLGRGSTSKWEDLEAGHRVDRLSQWWGVGPLRDMSTRKCLGIGHLDRGRARRVEGNGHVARRSGCIEMAEPGPRPGYTLGGRIGRCEMR